MNQYNNGYQPMNAPQGNGVASRFCPKCGAKLVEGSMFCGACGQRAPEAAAPAAQPAYNGYSSVNQNANQPVYQQQYQAPIQQAPIQQVPVYNPPAQTYAPPMGQRIDKKEFFENYADPKLKKDFKSTAIICYVCAVATIIMSAVFVDVFGIVAGVLLLGLALGFHLSKSKVCAIFILVLAIISFLISAAFGNYPVMGLISGFWSVSTTNKLDKQYKQFLANK